MAYNIFERWPFTSFQNLNLDWLITAMKEAVEKSTNAEETAENLKQFVNTYFDNLDVQEEINNKIDEMVESGEFLDAIDDFITNTTSSYIGQWLEENITPTTPIVDASLSVSGAAADARVTGNRLSNAEDGLLNGHAPILKQVNWIDGYVDSNGLVKQSSLSQTAVVPMSAGEYLEIGTRNTNITVIGTTPNNSVEVGDMVTPYCFTGYRDEFLTFAYNALTNVNVVICVRKDNYSLSFFVDEYAKTEIDQLRENVLSHAETMLWKQSYSIALGAGYFNNQTRVQVNFPAGTKYKFKIDDRDGCIRKYFFYVGSSSDYVEYLPNREYIKTATSNISVIAFYVPNEDAISSGTISISVYKVEEDPDSVEAKADSALLKASQYENVVPEYYRADDYLKNKADRINELGESADDVFVFITDVHWELNAKHSPDLIGYLSNKCNILKMIDGGDVADGVISEAVKAYRNHFTREIYRATGNHDWFAPETGRSLYYAFDSLNNTQIGNAFEHYWYFDNVQQKIRYITLDSFKHQGNDPSSGWQYGFDAEQVAWFSNVALDVPSEWDVIVVTHFLRTTTINIDRGAQIESAISAFNSDASRTGKVLAVFQGHAHWDAVYHTASGVPVITTTCDKWDLSNEPELASEQPYRVLGTKSEQAFDVVILNRAEHKFNCVRIGALAQNNIDKYRTDAGFEWAGTLEERVVSYD